MMMRVWAGLLSLLLLMFSTQSMALQLAEQLIYIPLTERKAPQTEFAARVLQPTDAIPLNHLRYELQFTFVIDEQPDEIQGIFIGMLAAYDAYWDGVLIGRSGVPAFEGIQEQVGPIDNLFYLPREHISAGKHTLRLVASSSFAQMHTEATAWALLGDYAFLSTIGLKRAIVPLVMSGAMLLLCFYMVTAYFSTGREMVSQLFCGIFCLILLLMMMTESWRGLVGYDYDWHGVRLQLVTVFSLFSALTLSLFSSYLFTISPRVRWLLFGGILLSFPIILLATASHDMRSLWLLLVGASCALIAISVAIKQKQRYARLMFVSLLCFLSPLLSGPMDFMDRYFFVSSSALIAFMLFVQTRVLRHKHEQLALSQQAQTRLELALLKKNLQPHFILNTLTAIEEWIEESPKTAVAFIQALADEFRTMATLSSKPLIHLSDEVAWCQSYLRVMGFRNNLDFTLDAPIVLPATQIPPGIVLTLIENAISHSVYRQGHVTFCLNQFIETSTNVLRFSSPVTQQATKALHTGLGNQYILARLTETFPDEWQFTAQLSGDRWVVEIRCPVRVSAGEKV